MIPIRTDAVDAALAVSAVDHWTGLAAGVLRCCVSLAGEWSLLPGKALSSETSLLLVEYKPAAARTAARLAVPIDPLISSLGGYRGSVTARFRCRTTALKALVTRVGRARKIPSSRATGAPPLAPRLQRALFVEGTAMHQFSGPRLFSADLYCTSRRRTKGLYGVNEAESDRCFAWPGRGDCRWLQPITHGGR